MLIDTTITFFKSFELAYYIVDQKNKDKNELN